MTAFEYTEKIVDELSQLQKQLDPKQLDQATQLIEQSPRIFLTGMGRSGNMVKALAIRLMHLGYDAYVAGDAATPSIQQGDLLIAVTSSGKTKVTVNHIDTARKQGANVLLISSSETPKLEADAYICIPAKTKVPSIQHAGSLFEQSVLIVGDSLCAYIKDHKGVDTDYMNHRHANLQ